MLKACTVNQSTEVLNDDILKAAQTNIPRRKLRYRKSTHPWVNRKMVELVRRKHKATGTEQSRPVNAACSARLTEEFAEYAKKRKV